ncbi:MULTISPECIES: hypothetical protein [Vibrio]|uniref:hypothetical protein n=1 Tax=Vibrio TaxID=662 RepID=UPI00148230A6|nr:MULTISPECIES: hypothetical protein [Vibrio]MCA2466008.1 hypothetical protein [Vibrio alginolyticus]MDW1564502.1 hypothetical protein [Vibrio sp. YT-15]MDW2194886.1 hypothetical protein [Vibrio sp. 2084]NNN64718.1 hypothetical protein [Vibrio sp. 2-1(7)]
MGRNWDWSYQRGREKRLEAEEQAQHNNAAVPSRPPLHSHDATLQSYFNRGWKSITPADIHIHLGLVKAPTSSSPLEKLREIRSCHFQQ